jgi:predicted regulator of Ras-like GTPase activity (Roadblock/LC7/MglB family)
VNKQEQLHRVLEDLREEVPDVHGAVLASRDGLAIVSTFGQGEGSRVAAMAATVHAIGERVTATTELGALEETVIRSAAGTFVVYDAGEPAVLALLAGGACNLGLIHLEGRRAAALFAGLLAMPEMPMYEPTAEVMPAAFADAVEAARDSEVVHDPFTSTTTVDSIDTIDATTSPSTFGGLDALGEVEAEIDATYSEPTWAYDKTAGHDPELGGHDFEAASA